MIEWFHPGFVYLFGAFLVPLLKGKVKQVYVLLLPAIAFVILLLISKGVFGEGPFWQFSFMGYELTLGRIDPLSMVFAYIFVIASFCMFLYAIHIKEDWQHVAALLYVGSTLGVVFAGDLITLFLFWEIMAWASLFIVWYGKTKAASGAGFRYIMVHSFGGVCLLAGILIHLHNGGSIAFDSFSWGIGSEYLGTYLIFLAFIINAAVPPLGAWLADAYPEASVTGAVFLTAFTTKSAIYVLLRGFPGVEILIWLGAIMALYGVVFAVLENDIRRLLAYHIISQVGYMVAGVGMGVFGTAAGNMAINGATAHAFCHILYKAVLFMGMGAVIEVTGRRKLTELGGIYKYMPITFWLYMIGAFSISGFPLFNGFISKTMVVQASAMWDYSTIWLMLELASVGTFLHTGLKLPWGVWFARDKPVCEAREPPWNMLAAMGIAAFLCTLLGVYPAILYNILPYTVHYEPYAPGHVIAMSQLLVFTFIAFWLLRGKLHGTPTITLDTDWFYRIPGKMVIKFCEGPLMATAKYMDNRLMRMAVFFRGIPPKSQTVVETRIDNAFHERVPALLNFQNIYNKIKEDKVREISYNVIYILIAMILLLIFVLFGVVTKL
ncbi:F(420)H(2) dehydrogenase subunit L [ANME-1 cluster archaeon GoMg3.2]|nr:F(420)H(2) dehydrogenase subunit L [ANME-1 cluster archaeon GoMg3.2]